MNTHKLERMTLIELEEFINGLAGAWNGKDNTFNHQGIIYTEDDALLASEMSESLKELRVLLAR
jgi:hypothetical protein